MKTFKLVKLIYKIHTNSTPAFIGRDRKNGAFSSKNSTVLCIESGFYR